MDPRILMIAAAAAGLWYAGNKTVDGIKHLDHKIAGALHHKKPVSK